ncbi:hypothetical protein L2Y96_06040 [Luteibacter aegosomaticola]|uniref:hypothetical protein n=1 Tax=Luteibacter aegosomaticola TaxID=2911538 RepID=UPI001FF7484E|nr:hypothetical protein [Luteibacter aegosomaticola]UPG91331.1 hypothetical protein L2Y96_06040 [Luteibacter aegosomaticola]
MKPIATKRVTDVIDQINAAFGEAEPPAIVVDTSRPPITDRQDAEAISQRPRAELDWAFLQGHADALYAMTPAGFKYYLPRYLVLAVAPGAVTPLFVSPIIQMLSPGPDESYWDQRFRDFWSGLRKLEYDAIKAWIVYMAESGITGCDSFELGRAFDTVALLSDNAERGP